MGGGGGGGVGVCLLFMGAEEEGELVLVEEKSCEMKKPDWYPNDSNMCRIRSTKWRSSAI